MRRLELLSPARDAATGRIAILAGADAVYIGAPAFGARAAAVNTVADIAGLAAFAHRFRAKVYVTLNTILFDNELEDARRLVWQLYAAGVDALIIQDMAYLMMDLPPIALHASTQCDIRTPEKARLLAEAGFSQLVLPRELSLDMIARYKEVAGVPLEVFVHGALCVSYSGDCQAGCVAMGRSANRGVCPQMCRLPYELVDSDGHVLAPAKHYLSLRDMNRSEAMESLVDAGVSSFKIEGRLKDARYVANVTATYSQILNRICSGSKGLYERASVGESSCGFTPALDRTFNRGYTDYFLGGRPKASVRMASLDTPKWAGLPVGKAVGDYDNRSKSFKARLSQPLANGDGLGYFDRNGMFVGFRLNKVAGNTLYPASLLPSLSAGTVIYRNSDKQFFDTLDKENAGCNRVVDVDFTLDNIDESHFAITASDTRCCKATIIAECPDEESRSDQSEARKRVLAKLGDTIYRLQTVCDNLGKRFVPASVLATARRDTIAMLDANAEATYAFDRRKVSTLHKDAFSHLKPLDYHDNVANALARKFYLEHGATIAEQALETQTAGSSREDVTVMTTRYCLRRELGACLKEKGAAKLPSPLFIRNNTGLYRVDFDCSRCGMSIVKTGGKQ